MEQCSWLARLGVTVLVSFDPYNLLILQMAGEAKPLVQSNSAGQWPGEVTVLCGEGSEGAFPGVPSSLVSGHPRPAPGCSPLPLPLLCRNVLHLSPPRAPCTAGPGSSPSARGPVIPLLLDQKPRQLSAICGGIHSHYASTLLSSGPTWRVSLMSCSPSFSTRWQPQWNLIPF